VLNAIHLLHQVQAAAEPGPESAVYDKRKLTPQTLANAINRFQGLVLASGLSGTWTLGTGGGEARVISGGREKTGVAVFLYTSDAGRYRSVPHRVQLHNKTLTVYTRLDTYPWQVIGTRPSNGMTAHDAAVCVIDILRRFVKQQSAEYARRSSWYGQRNS